MELMKRTDYIILLLSLFFISCSDEEHNTATYFRAYTSFHPKESTGWSDNDIIGISAYNSKNSREYYGSINKRYRTNENGVFTPVTSEDKILRPLSSESIDLIAYHPYQEGALTMYNIELGDQSSQKSIDLLYSNNLKSITKESTGSELIFDHVLSKLVFNIQVSENVTIGDLDGMTITLENVLKNGTFDLINGNLEPYGEPTSIVMNSSGNISEAIIFPGSSTNISFTISLLNGNIYKADLPKGQEFSSKSIYSYNVKITHTEIFLEAISIADWNGTGDYIKEGIADEIVYKTGDYYPNPNNPATAIGVVFWLKPGTNGKEGKITSFDVAYKSWGNENSLYHLETSIVSGTENLSLAVRKDQELENLPAFQWCAQKGEGWYFPARYELHILQERWSVNQNYMNIQIIKKGGTPLSSEDVYLSSSENRNNQEKVFQAETYDFNSKGWPSISKTTVGMIRATKEF